jgi:hypothetical protein
MSKSYAIASKSYAIAGESYAVVINSHAMTSRSCLISQDVNLLAPYVVTLSLPTKKLIRIAALSAPISSN